MSKTVLSLLIFVILLVGGGGLFLVTWEIPPPTVPVEKTIPDERLPQ